MTSRTRSELGTDEKKLCQWTCADGLLATSHMRARESILDRGLVTSTSLTPANDATLIARTRRALAREHHGSRGEQPDTNVSSRQAADRHSRRSSNDRCRGHGRRPSTIPEEPRESLQLALEHAAERLAEGAVESALDRARHRGAGLGDHADVMPCQDDRRRRRPRRSRETEP